MKGLVRVANETSGEKAGLWSFLEEKPANQQPTANSSPHSLLSPLPPPSASPGDADHHRGPSALTAG